MKYTRCGHSAITFGSKIYVFGGVSATGAVLDAVEEYDPGTDTWTTKSSMPTARDSFAAVAFDDGIFLIGGTTSELAFNDAYYPEADAYVSHINMPIGLYGLCGAEANGKIYVINGYTGGAVTMLTLEYTPPKVFYMHTKD